MRTILTALLALAAGFAQAASMFEPGVNLDPPGVLESIAQRDAAHYRKIMDVLRAAQAQPCDTIPPVLKVQHRVHCGSFPLLTSFPAKRHITFVVDEVAYVSNVVQSNLAGSVTKVPATPK